MTRTQLIQQIAEHYGAEPEYIFRDDDDTAVFRHSNNRKWFAIVMKVPARSLGLGGPEPLDVVNFKADPFYIGSLLGQPGFLPAYHMNKTHWISALLEPDPRDGGTRRMPVTPAPDEDIHLLLDQSFELTGVRPPVFTDADR